MSRLKKHYIVYETTNNINGMTYIGCHGTYDLEDGYIGCGIYSQADAESKLRHRNTGAFPSAVCEFGYENFSTRIINNFTTRKEAAALETSILNEEFISLGSNYNNQIGGMSDSIPRQEIDEQNMYDLYMGGMSTLSVSLEMGVSKAVIDRRLKGWDTSSRTNIHDKGIDPAQVLELYMSGMTQLQIAEDLGVKESRVHSRLSRMDTSLRPDPYKIDVEEAYKLYMSGMSYASIGKQLGVHKNVVYRRLFGMDKSGRKVVQPTPTKTRVMRWFVEHYDHYQDLYDQGKISKQGINDACPWDLTKYGLTKEFTKEKASA